MSNMGKHTKRIIATVMAGMCIMAALSGCSHINGNEKYTLDEENKLIVYTAHKEEIYQPIIREFEERSGIWVDVISGGTNQMLDRIAQENGSGSGDIMFGGGVDSLAAYEQYFSSYAVSQRSNLDDTYASRTDSYTVFSKLPVVFIYNTKLVLPSGAPRSWKRLTDYQWDGVISFADPMKSGSSYTALLTMVQIASDENDQPTRIVEDFAHMLEGSLSSGSNTVVDDVASGDKLIGITLEETALKKMAQGADIAMVYPDDGTCAVPDGCAIIKGAKHRENAEKFMEFIVSDDVQKLLEEQLYRRSVRSDFASSEVPGEVRYDMNYSESIRSEVLSVWQNSFTAKKVEEQ